MKTNERSVTATPVTLHVIGPVLATDHQGHKVHLSSAITQLMAVLTAAGPQGVTKDDLAAQLWEEPIPPSWKSALRNRITRARSALGADSIINVSSRYRLGTDIHIESMGLLNEKLAFVPAPTAGLDWLHGVPLAGVGDSPLVVQFRQRVHAARTSLLRELVGSADLSLTHRHLATLRQYATESGFEPGVTADVVVAHLRAGERISARHIVDDARTQIEATGGDAAWIGDLARMVDPDASIDHSADPNAAGVSPTVADFQRQWSAESKRSALFWDAARDQQWSLAYEIATDGVVQRTPVGGLFDRSPMLVAIPLDELDAARRLRLAATLAWQMRVTNPEQAVHWARVARDLACSQDQDSLADVAAALAGDVTDERALLTAPAAMLENHVEAADMQGYQVVVANHLERSPWHAVAPIVRRFHELVEASAEPYRRWHGMNLLGMQHFVDGDWPACRRVAKQSRDYGDFSGLAEASLAWNCHLMNQHWVAGQAVDPEVRIGFLNEEPTMIGRGLAALASEDSVVVEHFLESFDVESRMTFVVPLLVALAPSIRSDAVRTVVYQRLLKRAGTSAIFGAGMMHLGPVDRMCGLLAITADDICGHHEQAIKVADEQQTRLWQVVCRRELATITGDERLLHEAAELATTPVLRELAGGVSDNPGA